MKQIKDYIKTNTKIKCENKEEWDAIVELCKKEGCDWKDPNDVPLYQVQVPYIYLDKEIQYGKNLRNEPYINASEFLVESECYPIGTYLVALKDKALSILNLKKGDILEVIRNPSMFASSLKGITCIIDSVSICDTKAETQAHVKSFKTLEEAQKFANTLKEVKADIKTTKQLPEEYYVKCNNKAEVNDIMLKVYNMSNYGLFNERVYVHIKPKFNFQHLKDTVTTTSLVFTYQEWQEMFREKDKKYDMEKVEYVEIVKQYTGPWSLKNSTDVLRNTIGAVFKVEKITERTYDCIINGEECRITKSRAKPSTKEAFDAWNKKVKSDYLEGKVLNGAEPKFKIGDEVIIVQDHIRNEISSYNNQEAIFTGYVKGDNHSYHVTLKNGNQICVHKIAHLQKETKKSLDLSQDFCILLNNENQERVRKVLLSGYFNNIKDYVINSIGSYYGVKNRNIDLMNYFAWGNLVTIEELEEAFSKLPPMVNLSPLKSTINNENNIISEFIWNIDTFKKQPIIFQSLKKNNTEVKLITKKKVILYNTRVEPIKQIQTKLKTK